MTKFLVAVLALPCLLVLAGGCHAEEMHLKGGEFTTVYRSFSGDVYGRFQVNRWDLQLGDSLDLAYDLDVRLTHLSRQKVKGNVKGIWVVWAGERLFDAEGRFRQMQNVHMSTMLSTTGTAVESSQLLPPSRQLGHFFGTPFDFARYFPLDNRNPSAIHLEGSWSRKLDDVPPGMYRLQFYFVFDTVKLGPQAWGSMLLLDQRIPRPITPWDYNLLSHFFGLFSSFTTNWTLPLISVGSIHQPHMPWILLSGTQENGMVGTVAREDRDRFALSSRIKNPSWLVLPPGRKTFFPCMVSLEPSTGAPEDSPALLGTEENSIPLLDYRQGHVSVQVETPWGEHLDLKTKRFVGKRRGGPQLDYGDFAVDCDHFGKYSVVMQGEIHDALGRTIHGGGTYEFYVGRPLTFSSTIKHGSSVPVGAKFPFKVEVNPPCSAEVRFTVDFFPNSDKTRKRTVVVEGRANSFGYYYVPESGPTLQFDEPGEYRAEIFASYKSSRDELWVGDQVAAGIIYGPESRIRLHGLRSAPGAAMQLNLEADNLGLEDRYVTKDESHRMLSPLDFPDCLDIPVPYRSGDMLYVAATYSLVGHISTHFTMEPKNPALRRELFRAFRPSRFLSAILTPFAPFEETKGKGLPEHLDAEHTSYFVIRDDDRGDMFPILFQNRKGYHPFLFPESNNVEAYLYCNVSRPGFPAFVMTSDSTPSNPYWSTGFYSFGHQFNAGINGDMPGDFYSVRAGLVYKDLDRGVTEYAPYASTIIITPKGMSNDRVVAPCQEPLFAINGKEQWLGIATANALVMDVGDRVSLGCEVYPTVPAKVESSLTWPDGRRESVEGFASEEGVFSGGTFKVEKPGVYQVRTRATYAGKTGDVFGSQDGLYYHFALPKDHPTLLHVDVPPISPYDVTRVLCLPLHVDRGYSDVTLTYVVLSPGVIMDQGVIRMGEDGYLFRFMPSEYAVQFSNFDIVNHMTNKPKLNDAVFFVFFVEAIAPDGARAYDARKIFVRGDTVYRDIE